MSIWNLIGEFIPCDRVSVIQGICILFLYKSITCDREEQLSYLSSFGRVKYLFSSFIYRLLVHNISVTLATILDEQYLNFLFFPVITQAARGDRAEEEEKGGRGRGGWGRSEERERGGRRLEKSRKRITQVYLL